MKSLVRYILFFAMLSTPALRTLAEAQLSIDLPLGPYYKAGKYIPVQVRADTGDGREWWVVVAAESAKGKFDIGVGGGRTGVNVTTGRLDAVVPWLVFDSRANRPRLFIEERTESVLGPALRAVDPLTERLVGWTTPDEGFARSLLGPQGGGENGAPAFTIIPIALNPAEPIRGHAAAWEALDLILLDAGAAARLSQEQLAALLACGVTVAVKTPGPPPAYYALWPSQRVGEYLVFRHEVVGPVGGGAAGMLGADGYPAAYRPVISWEPGWPWAFRRRLLLIAVAVCIPLLALALWRPRLTWLWSTGYIAGAVVFLSYWWEAQLLVQQTGGEVIVRTDGLTQTDGWTYQTTTENRDATVRWLDVTHPLFASRRGMDSTWMSLGCDTTGRPIFFHARLPGGAKLAYLSRSVGPRAPQTEPATPVQSPLAALAEELYLTGGGRLAGELPGSVTAPPAWGYLEVQQWKAIVIDRRTAAPPVGRR